jgi:DNA ligase-1
VTLFHDVAAASAEVAGLAGRLDKVGRLASLLGRLGADEVPLAVAWLSGTTPRGKVGVGWASLTEALQVPAAADPTLAVADVDEALAQIALATGPGSRARRRATLESLFSRSTPLERDFLGRLLMGELRQGAQESLVIDALARASGVPAERIRRSVMLRGAATAVSRSVFEGQQESLPEDTIELFRPVKPMLASPADGVEDALGRFAPALFEYKFDGGRVQVHKEDDQVRVYTRRLNDETDALPEVVEAVRALGARSLVLDGEALALGPDGRPRPFQESMRRFGRKRDIESLRAAIPLSPYFFDLLLLDGKPLIDLPAAERCRLLADVVPPELSAPRLLTADPDEARAFARAALAAGHEGVMAKDPAAPYASGRRGRAWLKVKTALSVDLVVLGAEWGHGRRQGWLSNLHLGARGEAPGSWIMVGKTFKGMTDDLLDWQTKRLQELAVETFPGGVRVRPEQVVEIAFEGVQTSPRYAGGLALRFARVKGYRSDKDASEADTIEHLREIGRAHGLTPESHAAGEEDERG